MQQQAVQVAASQFAADGLGHRFVLRKPLAKVTARLCAQCGADVFSHSRAEVPDADALMIVNAVADQSASELIAGSLYVGSFKAAIAMSKANDVAVVNCAGQALHNFLPLSRAPFDALRAAGRCYDLEWADTEDFVLKVQEVAEAIAWARAQMVAGRRVIINCAQGKSRSGTLAVSYMVAHFDTDVATALRQAQSVRPFLEPNRGFMRQLVQMEPALRQLGEGWTRLSQEQVAPEQIFAPARWTAAMFKERMKRERCDGEG